MFYISNTVIGYIFTVLSYLVFFISRFCKEKKNLLFLDILSKVLIMISLFFLNSITGMFIMGFLIIILILAKIKETHQFNKYLTISLFIFFCIVYLINMILTFEGILSILVTIVAYIVLISIWWCNPQQIRLLGLVDCIFYLFYQLSIRNYAGLLEIFSIISNILSYVKYRKNQKEN